MTTTRLEENEIIKKDKKNVRFKQDSFDIEEHSLN